MAKNLAAAAVCRWTGRILGVALVVVCLAIAIGERMPNPLTQPPAVQVGFLALAALLVGILVACFRESTGAILSLAGWIAFMIVAAHRIRGPSYFVLLLAAPGILFLISALLRRRQRLPPQP